MREFKGQEVSKLNLLYFTIKRSWSFYENKTMSTSAEQMGFVTETIGKKRQHYWTKRVFQKEIKHFSSYLICLIDVVFHQIHLTGYNIVIYLIKILNIKYP